MLHFVHLAGVLCSLLLSLDEVLSAAVAASAWFGFCQCCTLQYSNEYPQPSLSPQPKGPAMVLRKEPWLSGSGVAKGLGVAVVTVTGHTERP